MSNRRLAHGLCLALWVPLGLAPFLGTALARAHEVKMNDGTLHEGTVVSQDEGEVVIDTTFHGRKTLPRADVKWIDTSVEPLREQLQARAAAATDVAARWDVYKWAKQKGFEKELTYILEAIVDLAPEDKRARKLLGHQKVGGEWLTPEQEQALRARQFEEQQRAQGLVPYEGGWVTPEEKAAREKGLRKDGDDWVTEAEYHSRRGEQLVDGKWIKVGFAEGKKLAERASRESRIPLRYEWGPHFDALSEVNPDVTQRILQSAEQAYAVMRKTLKPTAQDYPETVEERIRLVLCGKIPGYARFAKWFDGAYKVEALQPGWANAVQRMKGWWWVQDLRAVGIYQFPNTDKTFVSNAIHNAGLVLLTRYKANYGFPTTWLLEGFAYYLEMESIGYSQTFTLGEGGGTGAAAAGVKGAVWMESEQWRPELAKLVASGQDPPLRRIARMTLDQFRYVELVKSWSIVEFLVRWDAAKFKQFIDASKDRSQPEEEALRTAYGAGYKDVDEKWRAYVSNGFKVGP